MSPRRIRGAPARSQAGPSADDGKKQELRCECGSLLARLQRGEIELKCRRCKRVIVMGPASIAGELAGVGHCACSWS